MKRLLWASIIVATMVTVGCDAARQAKPAPRKTGVAEPPLLLDDSEPPLLLDGSEPLFLLDQGNPELAKLPPPKGPVADNSRCFVCHMNYSQEELAVRHSRHNIGCETCHGPCDAHCNDENNITPPTIMYPRSSIVAACMKCHKENKLAEEEKHWPLLTPTGKKPAKVCTDCHGKHRLSRRTSRWDKKTRKLLVGGWQKQGK